VVAEYEKLDAVLKTVEAGKKVANRLFYMALPPSVYETTSQAIHDSVVGMSKTYVI
jgi:glucose-6-phosphate 1-dehydrogenase